MITEETIRKHAKELAEELDKFCAKVSDLDTEISEYSHYCASDRNAKEYYPSTVDSVEENLADALVMLNDMATDYSDIKA